MRAQPAPAGHAAAAAHLARQVLPGDAGLQHEQDAGQAGAVRDPRAPALGLGRLRREPRLNDAPELIRHQRLHAPEGYKLRATVSLGVPSKALDSTKWCG